MAVQNDYKWFEIRQRSVGMKKRDISLDVLKVLTMFLIINSHSDILYPQKIQFLASGG